MKKIVTLLCCAILTLGIFAGCGTKEANNTSGTAAPTVTAAPTDTATPTPTAAPKKTLVTLVNGSNEINLTEDDFKASPTKQKITDPNLKKTHDFEGITLNDLMTKANAQSCKTIKIIAKDKFTVDIKAEDAVKYPIMIANVQDGGKIPSGEGGPIKLVYPYDQYPDVQKLYKADKWNWYVVKIEFEN